MRQLLGAEHLCQLTQQAYNKAATSSVRYTSDLNLKNTPKATHPGLHFLQYVLMCLRQSVSQSEKRVYVMKKRKYGFENITVASPCHESWGNMTGDDRVRFCGACERPVYNLSSLNGHEIASLIKETEGSRKCVRFYRREDGTMLTKDCPVGFARARRRVMGAFASFAAAALGGTALYKYFEDQQQPAIMGLMMPVEPPDDPALMGEMISLDVIESP